MTPRKLGILFINGRVENSVMERPPKLHLLKCAVEARSLHRIAMPVIRRVFRPHANRSLVAYTKRDIVVVERRPDVAVGRFALLVPIIKS